MLVWHQRRLCGVCKGIAHVADIDAYFFRICQALTR
ncbi:PspC domain-containing protein [Pseudomonas salomonii]